MKNLIVITLLASPLLFAWTPSPGGPGTDAGGTDASPTSDTGANPDASVVSDAGPMVGYTSRTDLSPAPETVPVLCPSAPCSMTSSDLNPGLTYTRVTDGATRPDRPGREWATQGSAEQMEWNADTSAFAVVGFGGELVPFTLASASQTVGRVACNFSGIDCNNGNPSSGGLAITSIAFDAAYSSLFPSVLFGVVGNPVTIKKVDYGPTLADPSTPDVVTTLEDVSNCPGLATTGPYSHGLSLAEGDQRMMTWFGGIQDQDFVVLVYDVATGCRWYDTNAGATGGQWGPAGPITYRDNKGNVIPTRTHSAIHNARMDRQGDWVRITVQLSPAFMDFWNISTNDVYQCSNQSTGTPPLDGFCDGHVTFGFDHVFLNAIGNTSGPVYSRTLPAVLPYTVPVTNQPAGFGWCCDTHLSWNNALKGQALPVLSSFYQTAAPTLAWQDEVVGISTDGSGVVWRFGQMYTRAHDFNAQGIANVSRDGKWAIFTSDWGAGRDDVYLIPLR